MLRIACGDAGCDFGQGPVEQRPQGAQRTGGGALFFGMEKFMRIGSSGRRARRAEPGSCGCISTVRTKAHIEPAIADRFGLRGEPKPQASRSHIRSIRCTPVRRRRRRATAAAVSGLRSHFRQWRAAAIFDKARHEIDRLDQGAFRFATPRVGISFGTGSGRRSVAP